MDDPALADDIRAFWFGASAPDPRWFRKDPAFDAEIRTRYGAAIEAALAAGS